MRFEVVQHLHAPVDAIEETLVDPRFLETLATLPKLGQPVLLEQRREADEVWQRVRYAFNGELSSAVKAVIDPAKLTWVEESTQDRRSHITSVLIRPDYYVSMFDSSGTITLVPDGSDDITVRTATGIVTVRFPIFGPRVESAIVAGLHEHAALEAEVLENWVASNR